MTHTVDKATEYGQCVSSSIIRPIYRAKVVFWHFFLFHMSILILKAFWSLPMYVEILIYHII